MTDLIDVEVLEIQPGGVLVKIPGDNRPGFIRRQELSWDRRVSGNLQIPNIGEHLTVKIIQDRPRAGYVCLSLRKLADPWQENIDKYQVGQVVAGEVVNVRRFGVFVQIYPGVDAIIWPQDLPLLRGQLPSDVLSVGDKVQGIITSLELEERKLELSLTQRLRELSRVSIQERQSIQLELFNDSLNQTGTAGISRVLSPTPDSELPPLRRYQLPISKPDEVLIIDDNENDLIEIWHHLETEFGVNVEGVDSGRVALEQVKNGAIYDLAVIDVGLNNEYGPQVAEEMLDLLPDLAVIFASANPVVERELTEINGHHFPFAIKHPEDIAAWIDKLSKNQNSIVNITD